MHSSFSGQKYKIGIYVRESRDDYEENIETLETQRELLLDYASRIVPGDVCGVYEDDNISGSAFDRPGLDRLKNDIAAGKINLLLLKDLSRLGRNNARTLLFIDFLEEQGVRLITSDGRYDSLRDNETAGLETWINERYVRDISRKIKASLRFKIERGEYLGHAPFGYVKNQSGENRLYIDESTAPIVKLIYRLYRSGLGYSSITGILNAEGLCAPGGRLWNRIAVRRILCSQVYTGDTVQGVSERISFKCKKTRRIPDDRWVVTENTHEAIIGREEYAEVQSIRLGKNRANAPHKRELHPFRGLLYCGRCGSVMYARRKKDGSTAYVCGNYCRNGRKACSSHLVNESELAAPVLKELAEVFRKPGLLRELQTFSGMRLLTGENPGEKAERNTRQLSQKLRQQELLYTDRLEGRITQQLFSRMNDRLEAGISRLRQEAERLAAESMKGMCLNDLLDCVIKKLENGNAENMTIRSAVDRITVYDGNDVLPESTGIDFPDGNGFIVVDFIMNKV